MFLAIFLIGLIVVPPIVNEVEAFAGDVPNYISDIRSNKTLREYDDKYKITKKLEDQAKTLPEQARPGRGRAAGGHRRRLLDRDPARDGADDHVLPAARRRANSELHLRPGAARTTRTACARSPPTSTAPPAGTWPARCARHRGGISTYIVLTILGVPFAVPLAVLMAFFDLIPLVGSTIGGVLIGVVTLFGDFPTDTIVWVIYVIVYQQIENSVFQPMVYRRTVNLHPLAVITAILIGSSLLGVLGALVAIPIAAAIQIALKDLWQNRNSTVVGVSRRSAHRARRRHAAARGRAPAGHGGRAGILGRSGPRAQGLRGLVLVRRLRPQRAQRRPHDDDDGDQREAAAEEHRLDAERRRSARRRGRRRARTRPTCTSSAARTGGRAAARARRGRAAGGRGRARGRCRSRRART